MSLLVHYTLKSHEDHKAQTAAMKTLVGGLKSEGIEGLSYSCFSTDDPLRFIGVLEFPDDETKQAFLASPSFAKYREAVGPTFANPPQTTEITAIASTRD
ncbi:MAG: putative quinol monooxygenase [Rhizobiaceae bacterium]